MDLPVFRQLAADGSGQPIPDPDTLPIGTPTPTPTPGVEASAFWALLQLDALAEDGDASQLVALALDNLAAVCALPSSESLLSRHLRRCLRLIERAWFAPLPDSHYVAPLPNYYQFAGPGAIFEEDAAAAGTETWPRMNEILGSICCKCQYDYVDMSFFSFIRVVYAVLFLEGDLASASAVQCAAATGCRLHR